MRVIHVTHAHLTLNAGGAGEKVDELGECAIVVRAQRSLAHAKVAVMSP